ncbi:MAG: hypothetical protein BMS9Abin12_0579 [Acidimicrobiia bacterium]|nr:MAG: hypothetical protein BMS9Abin12_0579 [Acidimicrobiia bacterium]
MVDIDLERLADAYRLRPMSGAARDRAELSSAGIRGWMIDVGGGTGDHASTWACPGRRPVVVDPASAMLVRASQHRGIDVVCGTAQALPFRDGTVALVYFHLSIHYGDWRRSVAEALRVTEPDGRIDIWTMGPEAIEQSSLGRWFPKVVEIDRKRFPDPSVIADHCAGGAARVEIAHTRETVSRTAGDWMDAVNARFVSTLQLLDDAEISAGLDRFTAANPDREAPYRYELMLTRITTTV